MFKTLIRMFKGYRDCQICGHPFKDYHRCPACGRTTCHSCLEDIKELGYDKCVNYFCYEPLKKKEIVIFEPEDRVRLDPNVNDIQLSGSVDMAVYV